MILKGKPPITTIVLHNTAVSRSAQPLQLNAVNNHHRHKDWGGGWKQPHPSELGWWVGYNFFCEPTGVRTQTRKVGEETIAQIGNNCANPPHDCGMISYCMAGYFKVEKPTLAQVEDFKKFVAEVKKVYPNVVIKQHKDVHPGRTCAELPASEIQSWFNKESKDEQIAKLEKQIKLLQQLVTLLLKLINK